MNEVALFFAVFVACAVEAVEATTIVLAAGTARDWRSALSGLLAGLALLAVIVVVAGPAIALLPIEVLRLVVGGVLLVFGLQWVRKAVLRGGGYKALHDEDAIYREELAAAARAARGGRGWVTDWYAFTLSFKGVLLEGLEVVFIVVTFGTIQGRLGLAAVAAVAAVALTAIAGFVVRKPLARVPENAMKFVVGIMLVSFGVFWGAEGAGAVWPGADLSLLAIIPFVALVSLGLVAALRAKNRDSREDTAVVSAAEPTVPAAGGALGAEEPNGIPAPSARGLRARMASFGLFWYDFIIGDDWRGTAGIVIAFVVTFLLSSAGIVSWWVVPVTVALVLGYSILRLTRTSRPVSRSATTASAPAA